MQLWVTKLVGFKTNKLYLWNGRRNPRKSEQWCPLYAENLYESHCMFFPQRPAAEEHVSDEAGLRHHVLWRLPGLFRHRPSGYVIFTFLNSNMFFQISDKKNVPGDRFSVRSAIDWPHITLLVSVPSASRGCTGLTSAYLFGDTDVIYFLLSLQIKINSTG